MELLPVVRGRAGFHIVVVRVQHLVGLAQHRIRRAVAELRTRLGDDFRFRNRVHVGNVVRRGVLDPRRVQAAGAVVAALAEVFLRRRVRRLLASAMGRQAAAVDAVAVGQRERLRIGFLRALAQATRASGSAATISRRIVTPAARAVGGRFGPPFMPAAPAVSAPERPERAWEWSIGSALELE
ncbi:hypothetical protein [Lysobacter gummosus]|uniref:hypothetical protein n=1 Tax=Lysobacter gummosus TaxID=262324 RepID=UPI00363EB50C